MAPVEVAGHASAGHGTVVHATVVLDIGKTNVKLALLDAGGTLLAEARMANSIVAAGPYPHHDVERIWAWLLDTVGGFARQAQIGAIVPVTHGATAALVDDAGLVLPVLDYEFDLTRDEAGAFDYCARPPFAETLSPDLPCGLNLGRQLVWQAQRYPAQFARVRHILMYPQYWAWRLCGVAAAEVTSLGCHTDLWNGREGEYSSLIKAMGWQTLFPPLRPAWTALGPVKPELAAVTGLPASCQVLCGIHDSNASLLRYLGARQQTVLSTGTWMIAAAFGADLAGLREEQDMLANTNALGQPVASCRFMGGREFGILAGSVAGNAPQPCSAAELERLMARGTMALPSFAESGGPFPGRSGRIVGAQPETPTERYALATLYCALMTAYCLDALGAAGPVVVEGSFAGNPHFAALLAALRPHHPVATSDDASGTTAGGWMLHHWGETPAYAARPAAPLALPGLAAYRAAWLAAVAKAG